MKEEAANEARTLLGAEPDLIDDDANFFGLASRGVWQLRGNGCLAASEAAVVFVQWVPRRSFTIPRERLVQVDTARSHLGKWVGRDLLRIRFGGEDGAEDTGAWLVSDLDAWLGTLGATPAPAE